jgi:hypothetical protein
MLRANSGGWRKSAGSGGKRELTFAADVKVSDVPKSGARFSIPMPPGL